MESEPKSFFVTILDLLHEYNVFGWISFAMPLFVYLFYRFKYKRLKHKKYDHQLERLRTDYAHYGRYADLRTKRMLESVDEETDENIDRDDPEIVYLKNYLDVTGSINDGAETKDYTDELEDFFKELFSLECAVVVYPKTVNPIRECLTRISEINGRIYCDDQTTERLKKMLKELDLETINYRRGDLNDFEKRIQESDDDVDTVKILYLERLSGRTGRRMHKVSEFMRIAFDNDVAVILNEALDRVQPTRLPCDGSLIIIYDFAYLQGHINGIAFGTMELIDRMRKSYAVHLDENAYEEIKTLPNLGGELFAVAKGINKMLNLNQLEIVSEEDSYIKVLNVDVNSTREDYNKTLRRFCKAKSIYMDVDGSGVVLHLYAGLYNDKAKMCYLRKSICEALIFCLEKENVAATL